MDLLVNRYHRLLAAAKTYDYSVSLDDGVPVTTHSPNCAAATGYTSEDYEADPYLWIKMVHPDDRELVRDQVCRLYSDLPVSPIEHRILHKNGSTRWVRDTIVARHNEAGRLAGYDGLIEDITERKAAEESLRRREAELAAAESIQAHLLPSQPPLLAGFDIAGATWPAEFAAGDYFDYVPMLDGSLGLVVADVSGHGLGPAIVMALTYAHLRSLSQIHDQCATILAGVNRFLYSESDLFVTMLFGQLRAGEGKLCWNSAGHPPGFVLDAQGQIKARLLGDNMPLAVLPDAQFQPGLPVELAAGDTIVMLTDGVLEARAVNGQAFGAVRALEVIRDNQHLPAAGIIDAIHQAVLDHSRGHKLADDLTTIVIKFLPERNGS